jgi:hypothetical protein
VGVLQLLLNRTGARLALDGIFGPKTEGAVKAFKSARKMGMNGIVDQATWKRIAASESLPVVDSIDVTNPGDVGEIKDARRAGGAVVFRGGMCNGVAQAIQDIKAGAAGKLFLVRMHGHGTSGNIGISEGLDTMTGHRAGLDLNNLRNVEADLRKLRPAFGPYGSVQLMGCNTGQGARGRTFLARLAEIWGVPVSAGVDTQLSGPTGIFRFEGRVVTRCPGGRSLRDWCRTRPEFAEMTPV